MIQGADEEMDTIEDIIGKLPPDAAMAALGRAVKQVFACADEKARLDFLYTLVGEADDNSLSGLVHR